MLRLKKLSVTAMASPTSSRFAAVSANVTTLTPSLPLAEFTAVSAPIGNRTVADETRSHARNPLRTAVRASLPGRMLASFPRSGLSRTSIGKLLAAHAEIVGAFLSLIERRT